MSGVAIAESGGRWTARIEACPWTPVTRNDLLISLGLYGMTSLMVGYLGFALGAILSGVVGGGPVLAIIGGLVPVLYLGWKLAIEMVLRSLVYDLSIEGEVLRIQVTRQGVGRFVPISLATSGGVQLPKPWPAAADGTLEDFTLALPALRGVQLHPHAIGLLLSADRAVFLAIRGHVETELQPVAERLDG